MSYQNTSLMIVYGKFIEFGIKKKNRFKKLTCLTNVNLKRICSFFLFLFVFIQNQRRIKINYSNKAFTIKRFVV